MELKITGKIKLINDTQTFDSGFQKREFVVTTSEQYPQDIKLECIKDRISLLGSYKPGDGVTVSFNVRGNEYKERYYVNLQAWKIQSESSGGAEDTPLPESEEMPLDVEENDDLPF